MHHLCSKTKKEQRNGLRRQPQCHKHKNDHSVSMCSSTVKHHNSGQFKLKLRLIVKIVVGVHDLLAVSEVQGRQNIVISLLLSSQNKAHSHGQKRLRRNSGQKECHLHSSHQNEPQYAAC